MNKQIDDALNREADKAEEDEIKLKKKYLKVRVKKEDVYKYTADYSLEIIGSNIVCSPDDLIHYIFEEMGIPLGEREGAEFMICLFGKKEKGKH